MAELEWDLTDRSFLVGQRKTVIRHRKEAIRLAVRDLSIDGVPLWSVLTDAIRIIGVERCAARRKGAAGGTDYDGHIARCDLAIAVVEEVCGG